jgi:hypothetical protein
MNILVCCNENGAILPFDQGSVFYCYDIMNLGGSKYEHTECVPGGAGGVEERMALLEENDCGILICGRVSPEAEEQLDRMHISPLAGCIGPADMAVEAFLAGEKPPGFEGCGGSCSSCEIDCES